MQHLFLVLFRIPGYSQRCAETKPNSGENQMAPVDCGVIRSVICIWFFLGQVTVLVPPFTYALIAGSRFDCRVWKLADGEFWSSNFFLVHWTWSKFHKGTSACGALQFVFLLHSGESYGAPYVWRQIDWLNTSLNVLIRFSQRWRGVRFDPFRNRAMAPAGERFFVLDFIYAFINTSSQATIVWKPPVWPG